MVKRRSKKQLTPPIQDAMEATITDSKALQDKANKILNDTVYWFPVRHHSPTTARYLEEAITTRKPKLIFIEGPFEANDLIPHLVDSQSKPPIAIYSSFQDDNNNLGLAGVVSHAEDVAPKFASWYPMLEYSPEYVALKAASKLKIPAMFMDLPHYGLIASNLPPEEEREELDENEQKQRKKEATRQTEPQRLIVESDFYESLTEIAGFKSWDETWDTLFEVHRADRTIEDFRSEMAYFCAAVRTTSQASGILKDNNIESERFMWKTVKEQSKKRKVALKDVMVICGGFHIFLDQKDTTPPPVLPEGTVYTTIVPYSFFHISELSGYAAGNRAPQYYQYLWNYGKGTEPQDANTNYIVKVLHQARRSGESLSSADAIAVAQTYDMLANLRNRHHPTLEDIHDALVTCCCKGDPEEEGLYLQKAIFKTDIGNKVGKVTSKITKLPILSDFYTQLERFDIHDVVGENRTQTVEIDRRDEKQASCSAFLKRLVFLKIPIASLQEGASLMGIGTMFKEKWFLKWSPSVEHKVIEKNLYGDTIEQAALRILEESLAEDRDSAEITCKQLLHAIDMDFPGLILQVENTCGHAIDTDARFISLCNALTSLCVLDRYSIFRHIGRDRLADLISRCFSRACFALPDAANLPEEQYPQFVSALMSMTELLQQNHKNSVEIDRDLFMQYLRQAALISSPPFIQGSFYGLLTELKNMTPEELGAMLALYAQEPPETMIQAGDFLDGAMSVSKTSVLFGGKHIVEAIESLFDASDWETFLIMLPKMRSAFERLEEHPRTSVAEIVAKRYGLVEADEIIELSTSVEAGALIAEIDQKVANIMQHWSFEDE